ncbi:MAG: hypothetical protein M3383_08715 [Actinomycetota bacterium]|nr:hypothetical protein [Actinomycetota bacterium]
MKASDRSILIGLIILGLGAAFWFLILAPKRERAGELETRVEALQAEVAQQEELAAFALDSQAKYAKNYERLVILGKAAPADGDTPSFLTQLTELSERSGTIFASLTVADAAAAPAAPAAQTTTDQNAAAGTPTSATPSPETIAATPTEAAAATLPLGATVGPAGMGVLPYTLTASGDFFDLADLLAGLDSQVGTKGSRAEVDGRLLTVSGFSLSPSDGKALDMSLEVVSYVLPESQGLTAGATPVAPPASVPPAEPTSTPTTATP